MCIKWKLYLFVLGLGLWAVTTPTAHTQPAKALVFSLYDNATALPGTGKLGVLGLPIHPGISAGMEWRYGAQARHVWVHGAQLGYHFQRYFQHALMVYHTIGYRVLWPNSPIDAGAALGLGYLHAFAATPLYTLNDAGSYIRTGRGGRAQAMAGLEVEVACRLSSAAQARPLTALLRYRFALQFPFVDEYVPMLPNAALHLGMRWSWGATNQ